MDDHPVANNFTVVFFVTDLGVERVVRLNASSPREAKERALQFLVKCGCDTDDWDSMTEFEQRDEINACRGVHRCCAVFAGDHENLI